MKKAFVGIIFLLLMSTAYGLSLDIPTDIPSNLNWSFSSTFDNFSFEHLQASVDGKNLVDVYVYAGNKTIVEQADPSVINAYVDGTKVFVSVVGLSSGSHNVEVRLFDNGVQIDSVSGTVSAFNALSEEFEAQVNSELQRVETLTEEFNQNLNTKISEVDNAVDNLDQTIVEGLSAGESDREAIRDDLKSLQSTTDELNDVTSQLAETDNLTAEEIEALQARQVFLQRLINQLNEEDEQVASGTGFFSFSDGGSLVGVFLILLMLLIVIGALMVKSRDDAPLFSQSVPGSENEDVEDEESEDVEESQSTESEDDDSGDYDWQGKWAFEQQNKKSKRFSLGDLIKRE